MMLRQKVVGVFIVISLLVTLNSLFSFLFLKQMQGSYKSLIDRGLAVLEQVGGIREQTERQNSLLFGLLVDPSKEKEQVLATVNAKLSESIAQLEQLSETDEERSEVRKLAEANATFARLTQKITDYLNRGEPGLARTEALMWSIPLSETLTQSSTRIQQIEQQLMTGKQAANEQLVAKTIRSLMGVSAAALAFAIAAGFLLSRFIVKPLRAMAQAAAAIASRDLTVSDIQVTSRDEIGKLASAFNRMKAELRTMVMELTEHAEEVAGAAERLSGSSEQVSHSLERITEIVGGIATGTSEQMQSVNESVSLMETMSRSVDHIAGATTTADAKSSAALTTAAGGRQAIATVSGQMDSIRSTMTVMAEGVSQLGSRTMEIMKVNEAIAAIAKQTNMLALNASIESARAGEAGKGFAVVAEEVRKLAVQTSAAAGKVVEMIAGISQEKDRVIASTQTGLREVETGMDVVRHADDAFHRIQQSVEEAALCIGEAGDQSGHVVRQSHSVVDKVRQVQTIAERAVAHTQDVSASVEEQYASMEEVVSSAEVLHTMSGRLSALIGQFRV